MLSGICVFIYSLVILNDATSIFLTLFCTTLANFKKVESHVSERVYTEMLAEAHVHVILNARLVAIEKDPGNGARLVTATFVDGDGHNTVND